MTKPHERVSVLCSSLGRDWENVICPSAAILVVLVLLCGQTKKLAVPKRRYKVFLFSLLCPRQCKKQLTWEHLIQAISCVGKQESGKLSGLSLGIQSFPECPKLALKSEHHSV